MMVLWIHCFLLKPTNVFAKLANSIGGSMFISIDLFFVLSGFLITGILIRTHDTSRRGRNFYARRFLRIFPAYYFTLVFVIFIYPLFYAPVREAKLEQEAIYYFLYVQNFRGEPAAWPGLDHLWSMAVEEQFYLLWPLVVWHTPREKLARLCAWIFALAITFKLGLLAAGVPYHLLFLPTYSRVEGVVAGAGLAAMWQIHGIRRSPAWLRSAGLIATVCLVVLMFQTHKTKLISAPNIVAHTIAATIAFAWMIYACVTAQPDAPIRRFFRNRVLIFLGTYSYGIYLLHWVVYWQTKIFLMGVLENRIGANAASTVAGVVVVGVTILLALAMYRVIEEPALRLKRFFTSARAPGGAQTSPA